MHKMNVKIDILAFTLKKVAMKSIGGGDFFCIGQSDCNDKCACCVWSRNKSMSKWKGVNVFACL